MSVGFRKSLFGFNCDDVVSYVEKMHKSFNDKEIVLNEQMDDLKAQNDDFKSQLSHAVAQNAELEAKLKEYTDKYDEIERLSQNIGKLYLVAKSNAEAIMKDAKESADAVRREVGRNISYIDDAHGTLGEVKENILSNSDRFAKELDALISSLDSAKAKIFENDNDLQKNVDSYRELVRAVSDE